MEELEDVLGLLQVLETMRPQVTQARALRQVCLGGLARGEGEQDLLSVGGSKDAGDTAEGRSEVIAVPLLGGIGVERYPHAQRTEIAPGLRVQAALGREGGGEAVGGGVEDGAEGVTDRL